MRQDMKHVIIDRPRTGGDGGKSKPPKGSNRKLNKIPLEEQPKYASNSRRRVHGYDCKRLNEHLSPLRRWMHKQVGRDWNEVWSEICDGLSADNIVMNHVRKHVDHYVEKNCIIENGKVLDSKGEILYYSQWQPFYINPEDNTLQVIPDQRTRYKKRVKNWIPSSNENYRYYLLNNVWYEVELKEFPLLKDIVYDMVIAVTWKNHREYRGSTKADCKSKYGRLVYSANKRQLNKQEIKRFNLWESEIVP